MSDYFAVFELPRKLQLDEEGLRRRFYELSRRHHPDFHQLAGEDEQAASLADSALINRAYRALRDPLARVEYLVTLEAGRESSAPAKPAVPRDLLMEVMEVQEALEEAKDAGLDEAAREGLRGERGRLLDRRAATEAAIVARGAEWDAAVDQGADRAPLLAWFKEALATRAYLRTVIEDLSQALGEDQDAHVSHRRH
jgi:molecular chaperone HscB